MREDETTILDLVSRAAGEAGSGPAILAPGRAPLSFSALLSLVRETGSWLAGRGIGAADRVAIVLPNGPEMASAFLAVASAAAAAPLNPAYREAELGFFLEDLGVSAILLAAGDTGPAAAVAERLSIPILRLEVPDGAPAGRFTLSGEGRVGRSPPGPPTSRDPALLLHTSGTTSRPKLVPLAHRNLVASARHIGETLRLLPADRCLNVMPLFHIHGLVAAVLSSVAAAGSIVATPGLDVEEFPGWLATFEPTWITAVPTLYQAILARASRRPEPVSGGRLRFLRSSSAALPPSVLRALEETFSVPVVEAYGMTEAAHQMASNPLPPGRQLPGSVGPAAGLEIAILDTAGRHLAPGETGEVAIRGENVFSGYEGAPEANAKAFTDGWFRTGDEGSLDADGYLRLSGRLKEIINRGGEKVSPREIDEVLLEHPGVKQAVAFAIPDPRLGEEIGVAIVRAPGAAVTAGELLKFAGGRIADFKLPRRFEFVEEIPKGPTGKLRRIGLAKLLGIERVREEGHAEKGAACRTGTERRLAALYCEVLALPEVGADDDFFALGGDSLAGVRLAIRVREEFGVELPPWVLLDRPRPRSMAEWIDTAPPAFDPEADPADGPAPLTGTERVAYVRARLAPDSPVGNRPTAIRITGPSDPDAIAAALAETVRRHPALAARFPVVDGSPVRIAEHFVPVLPRVEIPGVSDADRPARLARRLSELSLAPFDVQEGPLLRAELVTVGPAERWLLLAIHHIVFDGWSASILVRELADLHDAFRDGRAPAGAAPDPLGRIAARARRREGSPRAEEDLAYFRAALEGARRLPLPGSGVATSPSARHHRAAVPPDLRRRVERRARDAASTPFVVLFSAFLAALREVTGEDDLVVGTIVNGRHGPEEAAAVGAFLRSLPVRTDLAGAADAGEVFERARLSLSGVLAHQEVPLARLYRELGRPPRPGADPFFDVAFQLRNLPPASRRAGPTCFTEARLPGGIARMDLFVEVEEEDGGWAAHFETPDGRFDPQRVSDWSALWLSHLESAV